jgi:hypothetical protein
MINILFTAQSVGLDIFHRILLEISQRLEIDKVGFYVAQSMYYSRFLKKHPGLESDCKIVKEWQIVEEARKASADSDIIRAYEKEIGNPTLWEPLVCDRRVYLGRQCKVKQDYRPSFSHDMMLSILQVAMKKLEKLLDEVSPDVVLSLDPVTFGDYLLYLFCTSRNIPMLFLRTTKIRNYVEFNEGIFGCSPHIQKVFDQYESGSASDQWLEQAVEYLRQAQNEDIRYEGMILIPSKRSKKKLKNNPLNAVAKAVKAETEYLVRHRRDHCIPGILWPFIYRKFVSPLKAKTQHFRYSKHYIGQNRLDSIDFAFYPLQSEPEISSLVWGKSYMNHIETIRNVARSLPVGMKLVVKEHPRALGYRSGGYYGKILQIPNVLFAEPDQEVTHLIRKSKIVIAIATFVAFEAVVQRVPSVMLGGPRPFTILPDSMIRYVHSMNDLAAEIGDLMENYEYKESSLVNYIAATMKGSVPVDYFTVLLKKKERYGDQGIDRFDEEIEKLAKYAISRITECLSGKREESCV